MFEPQHFLFLKEESIDIRAGNSVRNHNCYIHRIHIHNGGLKTSDRGWTVLNVLKALMQNCKMANATQILQLLFSLKMTSQELLRKTQTCKSLYLQKLVQPRLGGFGAIMNTVYCIQTSGNNINCIIYHGNICDASKTALISPTKLVPFEVKPWNACRFVFSLFFPN